MSADPDRDDTPPIGAWKAYYDRLKDVKKAIAETEKAIEEAHEACPACLDGHDVPEYLDDEIVRVQTIIDRHDNPKDE